MSDHEDIHVDPPSAEAPRAEGSAAPRPEDRPTRTTEMLRIYGSEERFAATPPEIRQQIAADYAAELRRDLVRQQVVLAAIEEAEERADAAVLAADAAVATAEERVESTEAQVSLLAGLLDRLTSHQDVYGGLADLVTTATDYRVRLRRDELVADLRLVSATPESDEPTPEEIAVDAEIAAIEKEMADDQRKMEELSLPDPRAIADRSVDLSGPDLALATKLMHRYKRPPTWQVVNETARLSPEQYAELVGVVGLAEATAAQDYARASEIVFGDTYAADDVAAVEAFHSYLRAQCDQALDWLAEVDRRLKATGRERISPWVLEMADMLGASLPAITAPNIAAVRAHLAHPTAAEPQQEPVVVAPDPSRSQTEVMRDLIRDPHVRADMEQIKQEVGDG